MVMGVNDHDWTPTLSAAPVFEMVSATSATHVLSSSPTTITTVPSFCTSAFCFLLTSLPSN
jgi:hypothetical protein